MLNSLKKAINREKIHSQMSNLSLESVVNADVKDMFLDDVDTYLDGSEDDPEMANLVDKIPEYDEDDITDEDLEDLDDVGESMIEAIPESILTEDYYVLKGLLIGNAQVAKDVVGNYGREGDDIDEVGSVNESYDSIEDIVDEIALEAISADAAKRQIKTHEDEIRRLEAENVEYKKHIQNPQHNSSQRIKDIEANIARLEDAHKKHKEKHGDEDPYYTESIKQYREKINAIKSGSGNDQHKNEMQKKLDYNIKMIKYWKEQIADIREEREKIDRASVKESYDSIEDIVEEEGHEEFAKRMASESIRRHREAAEQFRQKAKECRERGDHSGERLMNRAAQNSDKQADEYEHDNRLEKKYTNAATGKSYESYDSIEDIVDNMSQISEKK